MRTMTRGERIQHEAWLRGDNRLRCDDGHLLCERCRSCACTPDESLDSSEYPNGFRVTKDTRGRSLCRECRYQSDVLGNF